MKFHNEYAEQTGDVFSVCPKAVFAAIAVSALTSGGEYLEHARQRIINEWHALHAAGIVPQKPPFPRKHDEVYDL